MIKTITTQYEENKNVELSIKIATELLKFMQVVGLIGFPSYFLPHSNHEEPSLFETVLIVLMVGLWYFFPCFQLHIV